MAEPPVSWVVCRSGAARAGIDLTIVEHLVDPLTIAAAPFLQRLRTLDLQTYGPRAMPSWVFYDCTVVPGALFGFARSGPSGLEPLSMMGVIPMASGGNLVTTLCAPGLATTRETIAVGARTLGLKTLTVVTQWGAPELEAWSALGPLVLKTAWTPAHDEPRTLTFTVAVAATRARVVAWPDTSDDALQALQARIEAGEVVTL